MSKYTGGRIVPKHCGTWSSANSYETLSVVLYPNTGDSYMSRKAVPAGVDITDTEYWAKSADYSAQMTQLQKNVDDAVETAEVLKAQIAENVSASTDADADYAAEVADARVGADGTTYASAGEAIREQIGRTSDAIDKIVDGVCRYQAVTGTDETDLKKLSTDNCVVDYGSTGAWGCVGFDIPEFATKAKIETYISWSSIYAYFFADSEDNCLASYVNDVTTAFSMEAAIPDRAAKLYVNWKDSSENVSVSFNTGVISVGDELDALSQSLEEADAEIKVLSDEMESAASDIELLQTEFDDCGLKGFSEAEGTEETDLKKVSTSNTVVDYGSTGSWGCLRYDVSGVTRAKIETNVYRNSVYVYMISDEDLNVLDSYIGPTSAVSLTVSIPKGAAYLFVNWGTTVANVSVSLNTVYIDVRGELDSMSESLGEMESTVSDVAEASEAITWYDPSTEVDSTLKAMVKSLVLYVSDFSKIYCLPVLVYDEESGKIQIRVYERVNNSFGSLVCQKYLTSGFVVSDSVEVYKLDEVSSSGVYGLITVEWDGETYVNKTSISKSIINKTMYREYVTEEEPVEDDEEEELDTIDYGLLLPSSIPIMSGRNLWYYPENLFKYLFQFERAQTVYKTTISPSGYSSYLSDIYGKIQSADGVDQTVTIKATNVDGSGAEINSESDAVLVPTFNAVTGMDCKILVIGDSFMDYPWLTSQSSGVHTGRGVMALVDEFAEADGNAFSFVGEHLSYEDEDSGKSYYSEARGGWSENSFISSGTLTYEGETVYSPFYLEGTAFNFEAYCKENGLADVDVVLFYLGMNGGNGSGIVAMIESIHAYNPDIKCIVCTPPPFFRYRMTSDMFSNQASRYTQIRNDIDYFDGKEDENTFLCPSHMVFHRTYHYINTESAVVKYGAETVPLCTNHHPNTDGCYALADVIYNYICYAIQL